MPRVVVCPASSNYLAQQRLLNSDFSDWPAERSLRATCLLKRRFLFLQSFPCFSRNSSFPRIIAYLVVHSAVFVRKCRESLDMTRDLQRCNARAAAMILCPGRRSRATRGGIKRRFSFASSTLNNGPLPRSQPIGCGIMRAANLIFSTLSQFGESANHVWNITS